MDRELQEAVVQALRAPAGTASSVEAYRRLSELHEQCARREPRAAEAPLARRGAVMAALCAGDGIRARRLLREFRAQVPDAEPELHALELELEEQ